MFSWWYKPNSKTTGLPRDLPVDALTAFILGGWAALKIYHDHVPVGVYYCPDRYHVITYNGMAIHSKQCACSGRGVIDFALSNRSQNPKSP